MSKYNHIVKFNGKYYRAGEEVPDNKQPQKLSDSPQQKKEPGKGPKPVKREEKNAPLCNDPTLQSEDPKKTERTTAKPQTTK